MDSCFPPLAALSLRDSRKSNTATRISGSTVATHRHSGTPDVGKIEILQDLDLYYIRQIAHNLKVIYEINLSICFSKYYLLSVILN